MKSQLSIAILDNQPKPENTPFYSFGFEYDVGTKDIKYGVKSSIDNIESELSPEMRGFSISILKPILIKYHSPNKSHEIEMHKDAFDSALRYGEGQI